MSGCLGSYNGVQFHTGHNNISDRRNDWKIQIGIGIYLAG